MAEQGLIEIAEIQHILRATKHRKVWRSLITKFLLIYGTSTNVNFRTWNLSTLNLSSFLTFLFFIIRFPYSYSVFRCFIFCGVLAIFFAVDSRILHFCPAFFLRQKQKKFLKMYILHFHLTLRSWKNLSLLPELSSENSQIIGM